MCSSGSDVGPAHKPGRVQSVLKQPPSGWDPFTVLKGEAGNSRDTPTHTSRAFLLLH